MSTNATPNQTAHAWTARAGTHGPLALAYRTILGGPAGSAGVQLAGELQDGTKAIVVECGLLQAIELREQLDAAIAAVPAAARKAGVIG